MSSFEARTPTFRSAPAARRAEFVEQPRARRPAAVDETAPLVDTALELDEAELSRRVEHAFASGRAEGLREGEARAVQETKRALAALAEGIAAAEQRDRRALELLGERALALATEMAERVLRRAIAADLGLLTPCVEEALASLEPGVPATLALAPADLALLRAGGAEELAALAERAHLALAEDATLAHGEAVLAAGPARVELRWAAVAERLRSALETQLGEEVLA